MAPSVQIKRLAEQPPSTGKNEGAPIDIGDLFDILVSRWPLLIRCLALTTALAIAYVLLWPKTYTATMSIIIDPRERVPASVDAAPMPQNPDIALVESQIRLLTSRSVLKKVVESQNLAKTGETSSFDKVFASVKALLGYPPADLTQKAIDSLETVIAAKRSERSYVIDVEVKAKTREKAEGIAQSLVDSFFAAKQRLDDGTVDKQRSWLDRKIADLRIRVEEAERKAQDYRDRNALVVSNGRTSPEQRLNNANAALVAAQSRRAEIQGRYEQARTANGAGFSESKIDLRSPVI